VNCLPKKKKVVEPEIIIENNVDVPMKPLELTPLQKHISKAPVLRGDWDIKGAAYVEQFRAEYDAWLVELKRLAWNT
jgi:hypothetical protein